METSESSVVHGIKSHYVVVNRKTLDYNLAVRNAIYLVVLLAISSLSFAQSESKPTLPDSKTESVNHEQKPAADPNAAPTPDRVRVSQGVAQGLLKRQVAPVYPTNARTARITGQVVMAAIITKDGQVKDLRVVSGHPLLANAALVAVQQWRYKPYMLMGKPVEVETQILVNFSLQ